MKIKENDIVFYEDKTFLAEVVGGGKAYLSQIMIYALEKDSPNISGACLFSSGSKLSVSDETDDYAIKEANTNCRTHRMIVIGARNNCGISFNDNLFSYRITSQIAKNYAENLYIKMIGRPDNNNSASDIGLNAVSETAVDKPKVVTKKAAIKKRGRRKVSK